MTVIEAIERFDGLFPNEHSYSDKALWLMSLDELIRVDVFEGYEDAEGTENRFGDGEYQPETVLCVDSPFDDIYILWLEVQLDYHNGEFVRYNNSITRFNEAYSRFLNNFNRTHKHKGSKIRFY